MPYLFLLFSPAKGRRVRLILDTQLCCLQAAAVQELVSSGSLPDSAAESSCLLVPLAGALANGLLDLMKGNNMRAVGLE
jgi:hypothetical protein